MNEPCKNIGCNDNEDGRCMTIACDGADKDGSVSEPERKDEDMTDAGKEIRMLILADTLEMWAAQIREHCEDEGNALPNTWRIEDWLVEYRDCERTP